MTQILYFSTPTCGPCKMFKPTVQQVSAELGVNTNYIDAQANLELAGRYNVSRVPAIIIESNGTVVYRNTGVMSKGELTKVLSQFR